MQRLCVYFAFIGMEMMQSAVSVTKNTLWLVPEFIHSTFRRTITLLLVYSEKQRTRRSAGRSTWTKANRTNPNMHEGSHRVRNMAAYERFICSELGRGWSGYNQPSVPCFLHEQRDRVSDRFTHVFVWIWFLWARTSAALVTCSTLQLWVMYRLPAVMWSFLLAAHNHLKRF